MSVGGRNRVCAVSAVLVLAGSLLAGWHVQDAWADSQAVGQVSALGSAGIDDPTAITAGPDGNLWFTNAGNNSIGSITTAGVVSNYTGSGIDDPTGITAGPDGNLWFTNAGNNSIGSITTTGVVSNYTGSGIDDPTGITAGPDGRLWFPNTAGDSIGSITTAGVVSNYKGSDIEQPHGITVGPDGNLWFMNQSLLELTVTIGKITTAGVAKTALVASGEDSSCTDSGVATGSDGRIWFTCSNWIGAMTTGEQLTAYSGG